MTYKGQVLLGQHKPGCSGSSDVRPQQYAATIIITWFVVVLVAVFMVLVKVMADLFESKACLTSRGNFFRLIFLVMVRFCSQGDSLLARNLQLMIVVRPQAPPTPPTPKFVPPIYSFLGVYRRDFAKNEIFNKAKV